jgi:hypothetical protein
MAPTKPDNAILLVSDITRGMKSVGSKALLQINKTHTIIECQIQYLKRYYNPINIYICTGFEHEKIIKTTSKYKNIHYIYNDHYEAENQVGSLVHCLKTTNITNTIVINNGVLLLDKIPINKNTATIFVTSKLPKTQFDIGSSSETDIKYLFYDLPNKWLECMTLNKDSIQAILSISEKIPYKKLFLFEMINMLIEHGTILQTTKIDKNLPIKINSIKDLNIVKRNYEKHLHNQVKQ